jgi:hypothetical protein
METSFELAATANKLKDRFLRACELKQTVDWEKIVRCFEEWAAVIKLDPPWIRRIEGTQQMMEALSISSAAIQYIPVYDGKSVVSWTVRAIHETRKAMLTREVKEIINSAPILRAARGATLKNRLHPASVAIARRSDDRQFGFDSSTTFEIPWMSSVVIGAAELGNAMETSQWYPLLEAFEAGAFCFFFTERCIEVCTVPTKVKVDDDNLLHSESGPAFVWLNDVRDYYWHGVCVESYVVEQPERITVADIESEPNDVVRKTKIERLGQTCPYITVPRFPPVTADELKERYLRACELKQTVNWEKIVDCFQRWASAFKLEVSTIVRLEGIEQVKKASRAAHELQQATSRSFTSFAIGIKNARSESRVHVPYRLLDDGANFREVALRRAVPPDAAGNRNAEIPGTQEWCKKLASEFFKKNAASAANAANTARTRKIVPAVLAAQNVWVENFERQNGRMIPRTEAGWDVTLSALTVINILDHGYRDTNFSSWYPIFEAFEAGTFCYFITGHSIEVCTSPTMVKVDESNRLHSAFGPAFVWLDDVHHYYWHGVRVESYVVDHPERITVADIEAETNAEVRRVKIERIGQVRYLLDSGAREVHRDDYGTLYRKEVPGNEPLVMVKVVNATPEPDGSFKDYFLRVPPTMQTAREAVAWTFGKTPDDYEPGQET